MNNYRNKLLLSLLAAVIVVCANSSVFSQQLIDSFEYANAEEAMARIDRFMIELQNNPNATGYFIIYGGKMNKKGEIDTHHKHLRDYLMMRRFDSDRITIVNGGFREKLSWDFWLVKAGEELPEPKPTIEIQDVITKGKFKKKGVRLYNCCE